MTEKAEKTWRTIGFLLAGIVIPVTAILVTLDRPAQKAAIVAEIKRGETRNLSFGAHSWRVLDVQGDRALLVTEDIIEKRPYNDEDTDSTWAACTLRGYLNGNFFYGEFSAQEQAMILETTHANMDNQRYKTSGGNPNRDRVFLLSIEEVVKYFGDSGQLQNKNPESDFLIDDQYNDERVAILDGGAYWWWLRSPGRDPHRAVDVSDDGRAYLNGYPVGREGGVRPALWLNL